MHQIQNADILKVPRDFYETTKGFQRAIFDVLCEEGKAVLVDERE